MFNEIKKVYELKTKVLLHLKVFYEYKKREQ